MSQHKSNHNAYEQFNRVGHCHLTIKTILITLRRILNIVFVLTNIAMYPEATLTPNSKIMNTKNIPQSQVHRFHVILLPLLVGLDNLRRIFLLCRLLLKHSKPSIAIPTIQGVTIKYNANTIQYESNSTQNDDTNTCNYEFLLCIQKPTFEQQYNTNIFPVASKLLKQRK